MLTQVMNALTDPMNWPIGVTMLAALAIAFDAMTRKGTSQALAFPLLACFFMLLQGTNAENIASRSGGHFMQICLLFTAVAIPAHMIERSKGFDLIAANLGYLLGRQLILPKKRRPLAIPALVFCAMFGTYVTAAMLHNVTAIIIATPIIIRICDSYKLPSHWLLCGALVASNIGGFSTKWGDTPNIVEAKVWNLSAADFAREVMLPNLIVLGVLMVAVAILTIRSLRARGENGFTLLQIAQATIRYSQPVSVDGRQLMAGLSTLLGFVLVQLLWPQFQMPAGMATIAIALWLDRPDRRLPAMKSLGFDVYLTFAAVFVMSGCMEHSWVGESLQEFIRDHGASTWAITTSSYVGTGFTEAASWATAAAERIHPLDDSHAAAWALGGGICAGSSSILTAASAGIILFEESRRFNHGRYAVTFGNYLPFGLLFSLFMLGFYTLYFSAK